MVISRWFDSLCTSFDTDASGTSSSVSPWITWPDTGQGARKLKSYMLAGGDTEMKLAISGRRMSSCMPIQAPKEKPAIQQAEAFGLYICSQSSAEAASDSSPSPRSKLPWLRPTPRKLNRNVEKPRRTKHWYKAYTTLLFIVPPCCGCGWSTSAIGDAAAREWWYRASIRPSG